MRLSDFEIKSIKEVAKKKFGENVKITLFGSRVDDTKRGGDIDLYIETSKKENIYKRKIKFLVDLELKIGEQKIDVIISKDKSRLIEQEAIKNGIEL